MELQEKKRALATAAIEGGAAVAKLSMADMLNLFKRDAEQDALLEDGDGVGLGLGKKTRVLPPVGGVMAGEGEREREKERRKGGVEKKGGKEGKGAGREEDEIFGRRW